MYLTHPRVGLNLALIFWEVLSRKSVFVYLGVEGEWQPTPAFLSGKSHGQRNLAGYSPWGHKESDTTEHTPGWA